MYRHQLALAERPLHARIERGALGMLVVGIVACVACAALIWAGVLPAAFWRPLLRAAPLAIGLPSVVSAIAAACEPKPFRLVRAAARFGHMALLIGALGTGPDAQLRLITLIAAFVGLLGIALMGDAAHQARTRTAPRRSTIGLGVCGVGIVLVAAGGLAAAVQGWGWIVLGGLLVVVAGFCAEWVVALRARGS
ncbi:MAG TPA: hypothetical protein VM890_02875 [Longimicrobium sp.]|jgi:hypothetical protein|nr:hypothetical protein [Longimicrobium sp.]